jgi:hypothetical protein
MVVVHLFALVTARVTLGNGFALTVHVSLMLAFGYFQFIRPEEHTRPARAAV